MIEQTSWWFLLAGGALVVEWFSQSLYLLLAAVGLGLVGLMDIAGVPMVAQLFCAAMISYLGLGLIGRHQMKLELALGQPVTVVAQKSDTIVRVRLGHAERDGELVDGISDCGEYFIIGTQGSKWLLSTNSPHRGAV